MPDEHHPQRCVRLRGHALQHRRARDGRTGRADGHRRQHRRRHAVGIDGRQRRGLVVDEQQHGFAVGAADQGRGRLGLRHHLDVLDSGAQQNLAEGVGLGGVREVQPRRGQPVARLGHRTVGPDDGVGKVGRHVVAGQVEGIFVEHLAAGRTDHRQPGDRPGHRHPEDNVHRTTPYSRPTHPIGFRSPPRNRYPTYPDALASIVPGNAIADPWRILGVSAASEAQPMRCASQLPAPPCAPRGKWEQCGQATPPTRHQHPRRGLVT